MTRPVIIITGTPGWAERARAAVDADWRVYSDRAGYVARLADDGAALILVDGADPEWRGWAVTPRTSPATRRVPIVLVSDDADVIAQAELSGVTAALSPDAIDAELAGLIAELARVPDPAAQAELARQCGGPLPAEAQEAIARFNGGEYYRQHDMFEALWMAEPGPVRDLYRAILQVGIAYYQIERGNPRGALKMLLRSVQWLDALPDVCQGVDIAQLRADAAAVRAELERVTAEGGEFDRRLLKPVVLVE